MIFLTVGTQLPFDRLVRAVDGWVGKEGVADVFGQIAEPGIGGYQPKNFPWEAFLEPQEVDRCFREAQLIVAHAGMGSIISAVTLDKPIVILPRLAGQGEHRNDHQVATARKFRDRQNVWVAENEVSLVEVLTWVLVNACQRGASTEVANRTTPDDSLIDAIRDVVNSARK